MADPFLDALGVKDPTQAASAPAKGAAYDPFDLAVRLTMLEEKDPAARKWVAGVMANRAKGAKGDLLGELTKPGAFEPWASKQAELASIDPNSDDYKATAAAVLPILQGKAPDPTGGATQFYAPDAQAALAGQDGRPTKASFDDGKGVKVGDTLFFGGNGQAPDPFLATLGVDPDKAAAPADDPDTNFISFAGLPGVKGTKEQNALAKAMVQGNAWKEDAPEGSPERPRFLQPGAKLDEVPAGSYYVGTDGKMARMPGGEQDSSFGAGLGQGVGDVVTTLSHLMPGSDDSTIKSRLIADQAIYGAQYGGDAKSGLGRFTGQMVGSVPFLGAAELGAAPLLARMGPIGEVLAGEGGKAMAPGVAKVLARGGSLATKGAMEGAGAAGLISSASDKPLAEQMGEGAVGGALLGPAVPAAVGAGRWTARAVRDLTEPLSEEGRGRIADRIITNFGEGGNMEPDAMVHIPGSVPTLAQATGNPGIASLERTVRLSRTHQFDAVDRTAAEARSAALDAQRGDEHTVADLVATRQPVIDAAHARVFSSASPTDPAPVVSAIDAALASPEAHMESVRKPLEVLRDKLVSPPPDMSPAEVEALHRSAGKTFGADAPAWTPEVMGAARAKLGAKFEEIGGKTEMPWDDTLRQSIGATIDRLAQVVPESQLPPIFRRLDDIASTATQKSEAMGLGHVESTPPMISGKSYQALTNSNSPLSTLMKRGDEVGDAARQIREHLDDALERGVAAQPAVEGQPNAVEELRATRLQYKNLKTAEAALRTAGPDRVVTPRALYNAVKQNFGSYAYKGGGPLGDVAEAAVKAQETRPPVVQNDPGQIHGMRDSLSTAIGKLEAEGTDEAARAAGRLKEVRTHMDAAIEKGAPGYGSYLDLAERSNEPVEAVRFLQSLKLTDKNEAPTLTRVANALDRIHQMRNKPGKNPAKLVTQATLEQLESLKADLSRADQLNRGRPLGSDTAQHIVTNNLAANMNVPLAVTGIGSALAGHPLVGAALGAGKLFYGAKNAQVLDALANRLVVPERIEPPVVRAAPPAITGPLKRFVSPTLPVAGGLLANRLMGK